MANSPSKKNKKNVQKLNAYARYTGLGVQMMVIIGICTWAGIKLDDYLSTNFPIFTLILIPLSVFAAIYTAVRSVLKK